MKGSDALRRAPVLSQSALPPLKAIEQAVAGVVKRWPDLVGMPKENDREVLAKMMLKRVRDWDWSNIRTSRITTAAVAVFDEERCARADLEIVRQFYCDEIRSRPAGAFLAAMVRVYMDSFRSNAAHTRDLAEALEARREDLGDRARVLFKALPGLFGPDSAAAELADIMVDADDPYQRLKDMGFRAPHASGLAQEAHFLFVRELAPMLQHDDERKQLLQWIMPEGASPLQAGADVAVAAILAPWKDRTPPDDLRHEIGEAIIGAYNDPRLHRGGIWAGFDPELKAVLLRWLTKQDMKFFCDMVTATQNSHMWPPRRDFWLGLYDDGMIDEAWVAFGSEAQRYARQHLLRSGEANVRRRFARQHDRGGGTSLLIMRIGNKIVVDGCHSYKTHIFGSDDRRAPKLYQRDYYCDDIMRASPNSKSHSSIPSWKEWVMRHV